MNTPNYMPKLFVIILSFLFSFNLQAQLGKIALISNRNNNTDVYVINDDGSNEINLSNHPAVDAAPTISPDGQQVAFYSTRTGTREIFVVDIDGSNLYQLTHINAHAIWSIDWHPTENKLVFAAAIVTPHIQNLYEIDTDGNNLTVLIQDNGIENYEPGYSLDGSLIFLQRRVPGSNGHIYIYDRTTQNITQVTSTFWSREPSFIIENGVEKVIYEKLGYPGSSGRQIFISDLDGLNERPISSNSYDEFQPRSSRTVQNRFVFSSNRGGNGFRVWMMNTDGTNPVILTTQDGRQPDWWANPNQVPVASCQDIEVEADMNCTANASIDNGSYDPNGDPIILTQNPPGPYPLGATEVTLTVTDDKGASNQCTATVTVVDSTPPIFTSLPEDIAVTAQPGACEKIVEFTVDATDNCGGVTIVCDPPSGSMFPLGTTTVNCTAMDDADNITTDTFTVTVEESEPIAEAVIVATNSIWIKQKSEILSGNIIVNDTLGGPYLSSGVELVIGQNATMPAGYALKAHRINIKQKSVINSDLFFNELDNNGVRNGAEYSPLALSVFCSLPAFNNARPGTQDITVSKNQTVMLNAGSYREIVVKEKGTLIFTGGVYDLRNLDVGQNAKIFFTAQTEVRIEDKLAIDQKSYVGSQTGSGIGASEIIFYVNGINGNSGNLGANPKAVKIGQNCTLQANIYAPNGTLWIRQKSNATGAYIAKDVIVGQKVTMALNSAFGSINATVNIAKLGTNSLQSDKLSTSLIPESFALHQNYPNPFNPSTTISFQIPENSFVKLKIYNSLGQELRNLLNGFIEAGIHELQWDGKNEFGIPVSSGIYLYTLQSNKFKALKKMLLVR